MEHDDDHAIMLAEIASGVCGERVEDLPGSNIGDPMNEATINTVITLALAVLAPGIGIFAIACYLQTRKSNPRYDRK